MRNTALYPLTEMLQRVCGWQQNDAPAVKLQKLETTLACYHLELDEAVPLCASLLSLPLTATRYLPLMLTPLGQRRKVFDVLLALLIGHTVQYPLLFILEDVHWADPSTLEWLTLLLEQTPNAAILTILTCHPMLQPPWRGHASLTQVTLTRLPAHHVEDMIQYVAERKPLPTEVVQHVIAKADGIPLFVEELTKAMLESRALQDANGHYALTGPFHTLAIPATLHDALMARLDRLGTAKRVAQWAAMLGRQFSYALLQAASCIDASQLHQELGRLVEADLLQQGDVGTQATYQFKHALMQEAAYQSLLRCTRQQYHQQIADILDTQFPETVAVHPELLAHHYTAAGLPEQAIPYLLQAGERAVARSVNVEATTRLTTGLELLKTLPGTPMRTEREVAFHNILGLSLIAVKGAASLEVAQLYAHARALCEPLGDTPQHFRTLMGAYACALLRGELQSAHELAQQCLALAQRLCNPNLCLRSHQALGKALYFLGELDAARVHLEQAIALYSPLDHPEQRHFQTTHTLVMSLCFAAWVLWQRGYPEQAVQRSDHALHVSHELGYPYGLADTLVFTARLHLFRREIDLVQARTATLIALATEHGFPQQLAQGRIMYGWTLVERGYADEGLAQMRQGLKAYQETGAEVGRPLHLAWLAQAYGSHGQITEGLQVLAEALAAAHCMGQQLAVAGLLQRKGDLLLQQAVPDMARAEADLQQACTIAHRLQAKSLALRAAMSLSRL